MESNSPIARGGSPALPVITLVVVLVLVMVPTVVDNRFYLHVLTMVLYYIIYAVSFGIITKTGQLSLAHAAFAGIGAYVSAFLSRDFGFHPIFAILLAFLSATAIAYCVGAIILRLRGVYFVLVTFLFAQIFYLVMTDAKEWTGGAGGVSNIPPITLLGVSFDTADKFYFIALVGALATVLFAYALLKSPVGSEMLSTEESEILSEAIGINTRRRKLFAFAVGSGIAGLGGALLAHYFRYISPDFFTFWESVAAIVIVVVGGKARLLGWILGALFLTPLPELLRDAEEYQHVAYGVILILTVLFLPAGLVSVPSRLATLRGTGR